MQGNEAPKWLSNGKIDEKTFCNEFLNEYPLLCINDTFYSYDGKITDNNLIKQIILKKLEPYIDRGYSRHISSLIDTIKAKTFSKPIPLELNKIFVSNGSLNVNGTFDSEKCFCYNRLPVQYNPNAPVPTNWLRFLDELLYAEDIPTLQEFMGYCLIPSNKGQKMLLIIGNGGEGKSRIGIVMQKLLGENMFTGSISKIESNQFARADLENELLFVDDDLKMEALPQTNHIKAIITAELPMDIEKKGQMSYQAILYSRMMAFGNGALQSLYDKSVGFFRRQILIHTKEKQPERKDDPYIAEKMCAESEGIFLWAFEGLQRLLANNYQFTISEKAKEFMKNTICEGNNIITFLESEGYIKLNPSESISTARLYATYEIWCRENGYVPFKPNSFSSFLKSHSLKYNIKETNKIPYKGRFIRGFTGIEGLIEKPPSYGQLGAGS